MKRDDLFAGGWLLGLLWLAFGATLSLPFAFHNDLGAFTYVHGHGLLEWGEGQQLIPIGRLLNALLTNYQFSFVDTVSDLTLFRAISLFIVSTCAILFWLWLSGNFLDPVVAAAVAALLALLPTVQLSILWTTQLVPAVLPMLLVAGASWRLHRVTSPRAGGLLRAVAGCLPPLGLLTVANFIYPPTTALVLLPTLVCLLFRPADQWHGTRALVARDVAVYLSSCAAFFLLQKYVVGPGLGPLLPQGLLPPDARYELRPGNALIENARLLFTKGGTIAVHLWDITFSVWSTAAVAATLAGGAAVAVWNCCRIPVALREPWGVHAQRAAALFALLAVGNTPNLASPVPVVVLRTLFVLSAMLSLVVLKAVLTITAAVPHPHTIFVQRTLLAVFALCAALAAQQTTTRASANAHYELELYRCASQPGYFDGKMAMLRRERDTTRGGEMRPENINPHANALGAYLPMELGLWLRGSEVYFLMAHEIEKVGMDKSVDPGKYLR